MKIEFIKHKGKRKAIVYCNSEHYKYRGSGLIQFLSNFCDIIEWKVLNKLTTDKKEPKLKILSCAVLNEDNPEFFSELMSKGVNAIEPEMNKQIKQQLTTSESFKCENCNEEEVEHQGDWCDGCNLPERSPIK